MEKLVMIQSIISIRNFRVKKITVLFIDLYVFILLGFIFHTSSHPQIFGKYTFRYFLLLIIFAIFIFPFYKLVSFVLSTSKFSLGKKKIVLSPARKIAILMIILILVFLPVEFYLRVKNTYAGENPNILKIENFHPFLQNQLTKATNSNLHIDEAGFRYDELKKTKDSDEYRIFVLGGSTVLNAAVPYEKSFSYLLEKDLRKIYPDKKIEVINAGTDGYTSEHTLIQYVSKVSDYNPDLVITWQGINDFLYSCTPPHYSYGNYKSDYSQFYGNISNIIFQYYDRPLIRFDSYSVALAFDFLRNNFYSDFTNYIDKKYGNSLNTKEANISNFPSLSAYERNLQYLVNAVYFSKTRLVLGNQPYLYNKTLEGKINWYMMRNCTDGKTHPSLNSLINGITSFNQVTKKVALENNVNFVDLESQIPKTTQYFLDDAHLTEKGNKKLSEILNKYIVENSLIE